MGITKVNYSLHLLVYEISMLIVYSKIINSSDFNLDFYLAKIKNFIYIFLHITKINLQNLKIESLSIFLFTIIKNNDGF